MAGIIVTGLDQAGLDPNAWEKTATAILKEQTITLEGYWRRLISAFSKNGLGEKITSKPPSRDRSGDLAAYVTLTGTRQNGDGSRGGQNLTVRNAAIAFYNEYGTERVPRRLWMRAANAAAEPELQRIAEKAEF